MSCCIVFFSHFDRAGLCPLMLAYKLRQKNCLQVLINEGRADTSILKKKDKSALKYINDDDTTTSQRNLNMQVMKPQCGTNNAPMLRFPSLVSNPSEYITSKIGQSESEMLDSVISFSKNHERLNRKPKHRKKKKNTTTVHINATEQLVEHEKIDYLKPNLMASGTKYARTPEKLNTHIAHFSSPLPIRHIENDDTKFHRLDPHLYKPNLSTLSDSRISVPKDNFENGLTPVSFGSTRDICMTNEKTNDFTTVFSLNNNESSSLNKFAPLPPIFVNSSSPRQGKKRTLQTLHPQE